MPPLSNGNKPDSYMTLIYNIFIPLQFLFFQLLIFLLTQLFMLLVFYRSMRQQFYGED